MRQLSVFAFLLLALHLITAFSLPVQLSTKVTSPPPEEYVLDSTELMQMIFSGPAPTRQDLIGTWTIDSLFIQNKGPAYGEQELYIEMEDMGFPYSFHEDGTMFIDSYFDAEGTWTLNEEERMISIRDTKGMIELDDYIVIRGNVLQLIAFIDGNIYISLFHKKESE